MSEKEKPSTVEKKPRKRGPLFGIDRPVPLSPGRPRLPESVKTERKALKEMLHAIAPAAIRTLDMSLGSDDEKNRLRASEIILSHTVPKLEEVETHDDRPLQQFSDEQLAAKLAELNASAPGHSDGTGKAAQ